MLPLMRGDAAVSEAAEGLFKLLGRNVEGVRSVCGIEQEFFLIDKGWYNERADIMLAGRALAGAPLPDGRLPESQCAGSVNERALKYMLEVNKEMGESLSIAACSCRVAPSRYKFAQKTHERAQTAIACNLLLMDAMKRIALRNGLVCLLHEKPFAGIGGSGKCVNWSLNDSEGNNLFSPGGNPEENLPFLALVASVIHAIRRHGGLLCAAAASAGNELRLVAADAPFAAMSVFLGEQLTKIFSELVAGKAEKGKARETADCGRVAPIAFTGAGFEFRMLGSSMDASILVTAINAIVAESIGIVGDKITKELAARGGQLTAAVVKESLSAVIKESKPGIFDGGHRSSEPVLAHEALKAFIAPKTVELFDRRNIFSKAELTAMYNARLARYEKTLDVELKTLTETVNARILPNAYNYQADIAGGLEVLKVLADDMTIDMVDGALEDRKEMFEKLTADIYCVRKSLKELSALAEKADGMGLEEKAAYMSNEVRPHIGRIERHINALEGSMPDEAWPLPKYKEMLLIL
jgi:glutamine synthetase